MLCARAKRRQAGNILLSDLEALLAELPQRRVHIDRVPEYDHIDDQAEITDTITRDFHRGSWGGVMEKLRKRGKRHRPGG